MYNIFFLAWILFFSTFIAFKSLQTFRDEIDDETLLLLSSMPYTRFKLIVQKWLALQTVSFLFALLVAFLPPIIYVICSGASELSKESMKIICKDIWRLIIASIFFQILFSTFAILISMVCNKVGTMASLNAIIVFLILAIFIPKFFENKFIEWENGTNRIKTKVDVLGKINQKTNLFKYMDDPELKDLFELRNWYTDKYLLENLRPDSDLLMALPKEKYSISVDRNYIFKIDKLIKKEIDNNSLTEKIKIGKIIYNEKTPKALIPIFDLYNKVADNVFLRPIKIESHKAFYEDGNYHLTGSLLKEEENKILSFDEIDKNFLDNKLNLTEKEKKIVQLSKSLFENPCYESSKKLELETHTKMFIRGIISAKNSLAKENIEELLKIKDNNSIAYFIDSPIYRYLDNLIKNIENIVSEMYYDPFVFQAEQVFDSEKINKNLKKWHSFSLGNNYLNILTQLSHIWTNKSGFAIDLDNYSAEIELKTMPVKYKDSPHYKNSPQIMRKYIRIKPESFKRNIVPYLPYILYPFMSIILSAIVIFVVYKKDIV